MYQVRIHGRQGQGVESAAELLAVACFVDGMNSQAFPSVRSMSTDSPVVTFCRIDDHAIRTHDPILQPDTLIILDPTLLHLKGVFSGLVPGGNVLINSTHTVGELGLTQLPEFATANIVTIPATDLALKHIGLPTPNTALLGGFAALTSLISLNSLAYAIRDRFPEKLVAPNISSATSAFTLVHRDPRVLVHA